MPAQRAWGSGAHLLQRGRVLAEPRGGAQGRLRVRDAPPLGPPRAAAALPPLLVPAPPPHWSVSRPESSPACPPRAAAAAAPRGRYGYLTWEWRAGLRGWLHPLVFAALFRGLDAAGLASPAALRAAPRVLQARAPVPALAPRGAWGGDGPLRAPRTAPVLCVTRASLFIRTRMQGAVLGCTDVLTFALARRLFGAPHPPQKPLSLLCPASPLCPLAPPHVISSTCPAARRRRAGPVGPPLPRGLLVRLLLRRAALQQQPRGRPRRRRPRLLALAPRRRLRRRSARPPRPRPRARRRAVRRATHERRIVGGSGARRSAAPPLPCARELSRPYASAASPSGAARVSCECPWPTAPPRSAPPPPRPRASASSISPRTGPASSSSRCSRSPSRPSRRRRSSTRGCTVRPRRCCIRDTGPQPSAPAPAQLARGFPPPSCGFLAPATLVRAARPGQRRPLGLRALGVF